VQRRYEIIRPVLLGECTATERAAHTHLHPDTIGKLKRRYERQGMLGLFPAHVEVRTRGRRRQLPEAAVQELQRLKGLYGGFHYRELGRIIGNFRETTKVVNSLFGSIAVIARWRRSSPVRASLSIIPIRRQVASI
jgi:hypothetical protein